MRAIKEFSHPDAKEKSAIDINRAIETTLTVARNQWRYVADVETDFDDTLPPVLCLPGEFLNCPHDLADLFDALERLVDRGRNLLAQVAGVGFGGGVDLGD